MKTWMDHLENIASFWIPYIQMSNDSYEDLNGSSGKYSTFLNSLHTDVKWFIWRLERIIWKIGRNNVSVLFDRTYLKENAAYIGCACVIMFIIIRNGHDNQSLKSWMRLLAFHIVVILVGMVFIQLFNLQLQLNSRAHKAL